MNIYRRGADNWTPKHGNATWQRERMRGPILPMQQPKASLWARLRSRLTA